MLKVMRLSFPFIRSLSAGTRGKLILNEDLQEKLVTLKIKQTFLNKPTLDRLSNCSQDFLQSLAADLEIFEIKDKLLADMLKNHEDWSLLTRDRLQSTCETFRDLKFTPNIYLEMLARNPLLMDIDLRSLVSRLNDLKDFFTKRHLNRLFVTTPTILTDDFDSFR